jgi:precorrin-6B methylase 2
MNSIVEIGCLIGRSTAALLGGCAGRVYAIDCWINENADGLAYFVNNVGKYKNLHVIHAFAHDATGRVPKIDMTFIDGDHSYPAISLDIDDWLPKTNRLICGHDYGHPDLPDVKRRVDEVFGDRVRVVKGQSIWYVELS